MNGILKDKVVIVTGGASGLGRATCIAAAEQGARAVLVADVLAEPREGGEPTHTMVQSIGSEGRFIETDVTNRSQVDALVSAAEDFGGVDVMVANAGITVASDDADVSEEDIDRMMSVNVKGVLLCAQAAARQLKTAHKPGSIVLTASMGGLQGSPHTVAYSTSKGGVIVMAKALAGALGPDGIRVNSVSPGLIETHMLTTTPRRRRGR
ncbi:SDR family NAD(P)-dependent oxidoreductase [Aeromicrobium sp. UC242_57]|uniref:SDR family NAD(P)-dependent oxidoreductase n=1 Tax=Aeromicrobium sp. UC242_57 TaxID=3374624 RepID=UPI003797EFA4